MVPPRIDSAERVPGVPACFLREGHRVFVVVGEGTLHGVDWAVGDVLVCNGPADDGDVVVLEAHGLGRPRLGTVSQGRLLGEVGEPCSGARWRSAGRLVAGWRGIDGRWQQICHRPVARAATASVVRRLPGTGAVGGPRPGGTWGRRAAERRVQLSLFAAAA